MDLHINFSSGVPIYLQLMEQIKYAVDAGAVRSGEQLPTIRQIAAELSMNPNTVAKAYRELEREGVIEVRHGSGAYVAVPNTPAKKSAAIRAAGDALRQAIKAGTKLGLTEPEIRRVFEDELARLLEPVAGRR